MFGGQRSFKLCGCAGMNRFGILVMATLYLAFLQSALICYNATYVPMLDYESSPLFNGNMTEEEILSTNWNSHDLPLEQRRFYFGFLEKSLSFAGAFFGSLCGTQPINYIIGRFGAHKVMSIVGIAATALVAVSPLCVTTSFPLFVVIRFLAGLTTSNLFPVAGTIVSTWAPLEEKGFFVAVLSGHVEISPMFTMPIAGAVAAHAGWPVVFYIHAAMVAVLTILWIVYYRDCPAHHPFVADGENTLIIAGKKPMVPGQRPDTPFIKIIRTMVIWSVWIAVIGNFFVAQFSITFAPMYLSYVLKFNSQQAGLLLLLPLSLLLMIKFVTGMISDRLSAISEIGKLRLFNSLALIGSATFFLIVTFFPPGNILADVALIVIPIALLGFSSGGYSKCAVMVSRQHSAFVMSIVQMFAYGSLLLGSFIVPAMTMKNTFEEWRNVFTLYACLLVVSNTIFVCFTKADPAKWTFDVAIGEEQVKEEEQLENEVRQAAEIRRSVRSCKSNAMSYRAGKDGSQPDFSHV